MAVLGPDVSTFKQEETKVSLRPGVNPEIDKKLPFTEIAKIAILQKLSLSFP